MKSLRTAGLGFLASLLAPFSYGQAPADEAANPYAVTTFECAGLYWKVPEAAACELRYREAHGTTWRKGLDLVYDSRHGQYRGSIIGLTPNMDYEAELSAGSANSRVAFRTRSDVFPIGRKTVLPAGETDRTIVITESGTPDAYHLVTVPESRSLLNLKNVADHGVEIAADYVIVRGLEIRNARVHGIRIARDRHDIVVEDCYVTFWGRIGGARTYGNLEGSSDSAVYAEQGTARLTIQRNLFEDPRGASNDWETGHPVGPQGITVVQSRGGNVIRYNDILSTEDHGFNDAIGGASNFSDVGNMNRDSDIYGNLIRSVWDDAIECEGANMNVRIWGNYAHKFFNGIATASTAFGPLYIYRNVLGESRSGHGNTTGGSFIKTGGREPYVGGRKYIFHNTALQPGGVFHAFTSHPNPNGVTRNNIWDVPGRLGPEREAEPPSDYDHDYYTGTAPGTAREPNGLKSRTTPAGTRLYVTSYKLEFYPRSTINSIIWGAHPYEFGDRKVNITDPVQWIRNPLIDGGARIPGFNDSFKGEGPDVGAFEVGAPPLEFGRRAYLKHDEGWAPWEK